MNTPYYYKLRFDAKKRELDFNVSIDYLQKLIENQNHRCVLSDLEIRFADKSRTFDNQTASLDRIDSSKGYVEGNVQWVHKFVNMMKNSLPQDLFIQLCQSVASKQQKTS